MNKDEKLAAKTMIVGLLGGFPSSQSQITEAVVSSYLMAVEDYSIEALRTACKRFLSGDVPGHNNSYVPNAPELAAQTRMFESLLHPVPAVETVHYGIGTLPPPGYEPLGPLSVDFGHGPIDMRHMSAAEKDEIFRNKGVSKPALKLVKRDD